MRAIEEKLDEILGLLKDLKMAMLLLQKEPQYTFFYTGDEISPEPLPLEYLCM